MTQADKQLLLTDLCARFPYGVFMTNIELPQTHYPLECADLYDAMFDDDWDDVPYLRPLSGMTEKEKHEYNSLCDAIPTYHYEFGDVVEDIELYDNFASIDWLNAHHFDYRGLIEKGLAISTQEFNPYKD